MQKRYSSMIFIIILVILLFPCYLLAYLDPGTGSYIIQMVLAGIVGTLFVIKIYWKKVKNYFRNLFHSKDKE
ncbi:unnamed protein product [marine sediment metagenome]|uniref:Uncharacterized protein n=1 Tax=marine sediment metagenome TaxID=412755 RepID=X0U2S6_9ZZZZ